VPWPGTSHGHVVRAERAHAVIARIHTEAALKCPGVRAVVTGADLAGLFPYFGHYRPDHPILARQKVRYCGEPLAVVVASSLQQARDASFLVEVEYADLEAMTNVERALAAGAPLIHPDYPVEEDAYGTFCQRGAEGTNEAFTTSMDWGDVDSALSRSAYVESTRVSYPALYPYPMEAYCAQARFVDGVLEVQSNAQHLFQVQRDLARIFALGLNRVRVTSMTIGGGYGAKSYTKIEPLASACAWVVDEPVRIALTFEESMYTSRADGAVVDVTTGFDENGSILARDIRIVLDTGAYVDNSVRVLRKAVECAFGPYRVPALRVRASAVYTNTTPASSYRGFGAFHTNPASESNLDIAAEKMGIDSLEIRLRNIARPGECLVPGSRPVDADLAADLCAVRQALSVVPKPGKLQGIGFGCSLSPEGADPTSIAIVRMLADGTSLLMVGSAEMGQGSSTVLAQIVAEELAVSLDQVTLAPVDTHLVPYQWTTGASRTTSVVGLSVQRACADVRRQLIDMAAGLAGEDARTWRWRGGQLVGDGGRTRVASEVIREWFGGDRGEVVGTGLTQKRGDFEQWPALWEAAVAGVVVSVDPRTGKVEVDQLVTAADVGKAINPRHVKAQELGGATQALGGALFEEIIYDEVQIANANAVDYRVPRISDLADRIDTLLFERGDGPGPYGAKPGGEGAMTVVGGAVIAAVARATGRWADRLPLTPEYVWRLMQAS
jgi:CO/xanthine dehydrogenase Mo-binding subunit